jgi:hypothetical protein
MFCLAHLVAKLTLCLMYVSLYSAAEVAVIVPFSQPCRIMVPRDSPLGTALLPFLLASPPCSSAPWFHLISHPIPLLRPLACLRASFFAALRSLFYLFCPLRLSRIVAIMPPFPHPPPCVARSHHHPPIFVAVPPPLLSCSVLVVLFVLLLPPLLRPSFLLGGVPSSLAGSTGYAQRAMSFCVVVFRYCSAIAAGRVASLVPAKACMQSHPTTGEKFLIDLESGKKRKLHRVASGGHCDDWEVFQHETGYQFVASRSQVVPAFWAATIFNPDVAEVAAVAEVRVCDLERRQQVRGALAAILTHLAISLKALIDISTYFGH